MSFPTMNAQSVFGLFTNHATWATAETSARNEVLTGPFNLLNVPAVVDVSGIEYSFGVEADGAGAAGIGASTHDNSLLSVALSDGGATGDNTTVSVLATAITSSTAFTDTVPRDVSGTSSTDLDANDWVNFHVVAQPTSVVGAAAIGVHLNFIYGKPASIN
jgi:hypothetical protein